MPGNSSLDAIIIGGGHNGLVCANVLARKNKRVLICEARKECGGMVNNDITNYVPPVTSAVSSSIGGMQINYIPQLSLIHI